MLIPSGWIHAVWTPENSLVIGGNFLTRMHYGMQIMINDIEKNTGVTRKFRYPHFQKVLWHTLLEYLRSDPVPSTVVDLLCGGEQFHRDHPIHKDYRLQSTAETKPELYNARYYSESELDGLQDLLRYILRTVMISLGKVHGVTKSTQDAVVKSLPKGYGNHGSLLKTFAIWIAWKRGDETIPHWAYPDIQLTDIDINIGDRKISAAEKKRMERQAAHEAYKVSAERRPTRFADKDPTNPQTEASVQGESTSPSKTTDNSPARNAHEIPKPSVPQFGIKLISPSPPAQLSEAVTEVAVASSQGPAQAAAQVAQPATDTKRVKNITPSTKRPKGRACIDCRLSKVSPMMFFVVNHLTLA